MTTNPSQITIRVHPQRSVNDSDSPLEEEKERSKKDAIPCIPQFAFGSWMVLNVVVTLLNKGVFAFTGFEYPMALSAIHMVVSGLFSWLFIQLPGSAPSDPSPFKTVRRQSFVRVATLSWVFAFNIVMGNLGIRFASVSVGQILRSVIPGVC